MHILVHIPCAVDWFDWKNEKEKEKENIIQSYSSSSVTLSRSTALNFYPDNFIWWLQKGFELVTFFHSGALYFATLTLLGPV